VRFEQLIFAVYTCSSELTTMGSYTTSPPMIKVKWPQLDITITAAMDEQVNPRLVNLLYDHLPYRSLQNHALVSGDHLYHLVPSEKLIVRNTNEACRSFN
jgi:hypothetical protein